MGPVNFRLLSYTPKFQGKCPPIPQDSHPEPANSEALWRSPSSSKVQQTLLALCALENADLAQKSAQSAGLELHLPSQDPTRTSKTSQGHKPCTRELPSTCHLTTGTQKEKIWKASGRIHCLLKNPPQFWGWKVQTGAKLSSPQMETPELLGTFQGRFWISCRWEGKWKTLICQEERAAGEDSSQLMFQCELLKLKGFLIFS